MPANDSGRFRAALLGPPRAWLAQREVALGPARQRAVFAALALRANRTVTRAEIIDAVWGESPPASAEGSVYTYISGLRRNLEPQRSRRSTGDILISQGSGYALRLARDDLDVNSFDRLRELGQRQLADGDPHGAVATLNNALDLWRGEALTGVPGPFAEIHRGRLAELRVATIEQRAKAILDVGGHAELSAELATLITEYPLRESLRKLLMIALYRSDRHAEALEVFREARRVLVEELGIEPGTGLRRLHDRILARDPELEAPAQPPAPVEAAGSARPSGTTPEKRLSVVPARGPKQRPSTDDLFVGRAVEIATLQDPLREVLRGGGHVVWIEGEAGIGKSELLSKTLADAEKHGCQLAWSVADELSQGVPLQMIIDCLGLDPNSPDPRRARVAARLHDEPASVWSDGDPAQTAVDQVLALVDELCMQSPLVLVMDDLQWTDEASVLVWHRLCAATRQLPLLLVAASRPAPHRPKLAQLRRAVEARGGDVLMLPPLSETETDQLLGNLVTGRPGPVLRNVAQRAAGNPLYVREVADALVRSGAVHVVDGTADVPESYVDDVPQSLLSAIARRLDFVSTATCDILRWGALFGPQFSVADIGAATGKPASELLGPVEEAVTANVIVDAGPQLAFRHPLLRQALYEGIPSAMREALHHQAAQALADAGAPVTRVAEQLVAAPAARDRWTREWLAANNVTVSNRAPLIAANLFERVLKTCPVGEHTREVLLAALVKVLYRMGHDAESETRQAFAIATDPYRRAEMRQLLAVMLHRKGETAAAISILSDAADDPDVPNVWRGRHNSQLANLRRGDLRDLDAADKRNDEAHVWAVAEGDRYGIAHALQTKWLIDSIRRDHEKALQYVDRALEVIEDDPAMSEFRFDLLDNKTFTLQNLDRLDEAETTMRSARMVAAQHLPSSGLPVTEAVHYYWVGRWDDALTELQTLSEDGPAITFYGLREPGPATLLLRGVAALIAGRRDDTATAATHLASAEEYAPSSGAERENCDFLLVAQALASEQQGEVDITLLDPILNPGYAPMMLRHQWLPYLVRLALDLGDLDRAHQALAVCRDEAERETRPARAFTAAAHCRGLISGDPEPVMAAVEHYRTVGRRPELAGALVDAAVLLVRHHRRDEAQSAFDEAIELFTELTARWDVRRAESRLREFGIHRTTRAPVIRPGHGWAALSPIETRIARLVANGRSNPDIAGELGLPRRTVQAHVAHLLEKFNAHSRIGIIDEVRRHTPDLAG
jgi:DNA-binding SARP family transcriptional activator/DNA-binding CsgD family transcriptional regulator